MASLDRRVEELERVANAEASKPRALIANTDNVDRAMVDAKARYGESWHPAVIVPPKDCA